MSNTIRNYEQLRNVRGSGYDTVKMWILQTGSCSAIWTLSSVTSEVCVDQLV